MFALARTVSNYEHSGLTRHFGFEIIRYMAKYRRNVMREFMSVARALGDENRVRALMALRGRELCVCQIIELLGLAPSTVSKHMSILKQARLVDTRKSGRWVFYRLAGNGSAPEIQEAIAWLCKSLSGDVSVRRDELRLQEVLKLDLTVLCSTQGRRLD
jgi:ArsR family transcriptional regulator, arsenate/arsenite/antimonite-responsive transcriptional repressor